MGKRKRPGKKKRSTVRERNWEDNQEADFSHDLAKHRRALAKLPEHSLYAPPLPADLTPNATVVSHSRKWAFVECAPSLSGNASDAPVTRLCLIDERLPEGEESLLAPGDRVQVEESEGQFIVRGVASRSTWLSRHTGGKGRLKQQIIAANVDLLVIVAAAVNPPFRPGLVDRFLIAAQLGGVTPVLCINKIDLVDREPEATDLYRELGLEIFITSCKTGKGLDTLRDRLAGRISVLAGHSGVGKSSLLNRLDPALRIVTRELSEATNRGRHATTSAALYELRGGIRIIDTPGIRSLGLWDVTPEEVSFYFPEIAALSTHCKYRNCTHIHELSCAVRQAVDQGALPSQRYQSYKRVRTALETEDTRS